jgi:Tol biopolymer transport system component
LPNLENARRARSVEPKAPREIESSIRSRRKPLEPRRGRKVGDPLPPKKQASIDNFGDGSERVSIASAENRSAVGTATLAHARAARSLPAGTGYSFSLLSFLSPSRGLFNHVGLSFLRYPLTRSYEASRSIADVNRPFDSNSQPFDLFVSPMPQSGSTKIVFASNREGSMQIYLMNGDGSGVTRLTYSGANDDYPRWSPNGTKILFQSDRDHPDTGYNDVYVMNSDGSGVARLTTDANDDSMASWSSDGSKIVFQSLRNGVNYQVYSMNADGSSQVCLTNTSSSDIEPSWSPNGAKIAFASDRDHAGTSSVYVMNSNGTGQQRLTFSAATFDDRQPTWSRDGAKIAFVSTRDSVTESWTETDDYEIPEDDGQTFPRSRLHINKEIYVMNADGSSQLRLTNDLANDDAPSWSPDGNKILFRSDRERDCCDPSAQIWTMNADGSGQTDVSNDGAGNYAANWTNGSGNMTPVANAGGAYSGTIAQNVPFHGNNSYDPDGSIVSYSWSFGDGSSSSGINPTHAYTANGSYTVTLTITDNLGAQATAQTTANISTSSSDQFAQSFLYWGLGRTPNGDENGYWSDIMRSAYPQGQTSMLMAMKEFGMTIFESQEYAQRNRTNHEYVWDLYRTYLMRDANGDQDGWNFWTGVCDTYGRDAVRQAFDESGEFQNIVAALSASGNPSSAAASLATAQVDPFNQSGNQVQARDCEWSVPLVSLPGRAGLDLGLSLSYSSLVWTRSGPYAYFDRDYESLSPGFTIGFPTVQWRKFDAQTGRNVYIFTAAGHHVELRQVGSTNIYEAADSSYLQLVDYGGSLSLRTTDGTELSFTPLLYGYNVTQIKDRNGNFITVENDWRGDVQHVTDTVGRTLNFIYDSNANLIRIEQTWTGQSQPHVWASFGWGSAQMQPNFGEVVGTFAGENVLVLNFVGFDDGSYTRFNYNGYAQVREIKHFASDSNPNSDNHLLNTIVYNYDASDDQTRLTDMRVSAENWTGVPNLAGPAITQFSSSGDTHQMTGPDGTAYKEFYGGTGSSPVWRHGLVVATQVLTGGSNVKKTTTSAWTQDDPDASYQTNPRVYQTDVSDGTNHRKTTIGYQTFTLPTTNATCSLPNDIYEYAADQTNVMRRTHTDYDLTGNYINDYRRIIGLPVTKLLYEGTSTLRSKTTYVYDQNGFMQNTSASVIQHDDYNYSTAFVVGRGNVTRITRWDVDDVNQTAKTENKTAYDIAGNVVFTRDALDHQTNFSYVDAFSLDGTSVDAARSFATFAYPTSVTDPDGFSSTLWYRYDFGAKTRAQGPPPQGQSVGIIQTTSYDDAARIRRVTSGNTGAYTHYVYGPNYMQTFGSVNNVAANYLDSELYSNTLFDGLGRRIGVATNHPGSSGGYKAQWTEYDIMGRPSRLSNPTEIDGNWNAVGDDSAGRVYTQQTYDWKGRPLETRHLIDGTVKYASYEGCGCAGGAVVTLTDEAGRQQKIYSDVIGRQWKSEVLNDDDSVYSTTVSVFNARDQVKLVNQYAGVAPSDASSTNEAVSCPTGTCQQTTMTYDGYGRLQSTHAPEQDLTTNYSYNPDDTINSVTDARGASATHVYNNNRGLVNGINYYSPSGVASTPNVSFTYDAVGNRTSMTDGLGGASYNFDSLSRLTSETRTFSGIGSYTLSYDYNYANELTRITDPTNASIYYGHDNAGRVNSVTGSPYGTGGYGGIPYVEVSQYASNLQYRAFGALKSLRYGDNPLTLAIGYDLRLRPSDFEVGNRPAQFGPPTAMKTQNQYYADDHPKYSHDVLDERFDRAFSYDNVGAAKDAYSGSEARDFLNNTNSGTPTGPYRQSYQHDAFGNMTSRTNRFWSHSDTFAANYTNNRRQDTGFAYDGDGRLKQDTDLQYTYDAAGGNASIYSAANNQTITVAYDGLERPGRRANNQNGAGDVTYYVWSSVTGKVITELSESGSKRKGNIYLGDQLLATQASAWVVWQHDDPIAGTQGISNRDGGYSIDSSPDPMGIDLGQGDPFVQLGTIDPPPENTPGLLGGSGVPSGRCTLDGISIDCGWAMELMVMEAAVPAPPTTVWANGQWNFVHFNPNTGQYGIFSGYDYTSVTIDGRTSGRWHPHFDAVSNGSSLIGSLPINFSVTGVFLQNPQTPKPVPFFSADELRDEFKKLLSNKACADFVSGLIKETESKMKDSQRLDLGSDPLNFEDLFENIAGQGGYVLADGLNLNGTAINATIDGAIWTGNAQARIRTRGYYTNGPAKEVASRLYDNRRNYLASAFHETFHHLARFGWGATDEDLGRAAFKLTGNTLGLPGDNGTVLQWSSYFNEQLMQKCMPDQRVNNRP